MRVLVVEDHPAMRRIAELVLEEAEVDAEIVGDGEQAVIRARSGDYDLILMDLNLPGIDGFEAARRIIAGGEAPPIWGMSASQLSQDSERCGAAGMRGLLDKPLTAATLKLALSAAAGG